VTGESHDPNTDDLKRRALQQVRQCIDKACAHYGLEPLQPEVLFNLRGQAAGQARIDPRHGMQIRFNLQLLNQHPAPFLARTPAHEVAHLVVFALHQGRARPHGPEWREVMQLLGADPSRCHNFDTGHSRRRTLRRFPYRCGCSRHQLTSIRHRRHHQGIRYYCRKCGQRLQPETEEWEL